MHALRFYFDFVSPYAYLAFETLPQALQGCSVQVSYQPVLFAGLLQHHGQLGPAEIEPKRLWTYRHVAWQARQLGVPLQLPAAHPFNPLPLLRLALACAPAGGLPNRYVCETIWRHVWRSGRAADDAETLAALTAGLAPQRDPNGADVKQALRAATEAAAQRGVFGVPTVEAGERLFWGLDALDMLRAAVQGDPWFTGPDWDEASTVPLGTVPLGASRRRRSEP
ncbi:2-hydroxychromene-2-carboxylate isomerase [Caldimonas brevitalea]|uniref:2-hydroxychromene-2-carboxylate isomerase n=1 Tax=Caldimonas brevitalea TaxID=413882 RepID=A0A0G3BPL9_9BURK|nr:2-hydroxychromene-2-carboxylate isomerase [Caldimonas brevitalea]AKJ31379.1 DSBA oxidoreductase [Caldimonas brevitalea]